MGRLAAGAALTLLAASCATVPAPVPAPGPAAPELALAPVTPESPPLEPAAPTLVAVSPLGRSLLPAARVEPEEPSPLDLDGWPFGWVHDDLAARMGLAERFWSDRRQLWRQALDSQTPAPTRALRLTRLAREARGEEALRAAWHLWSVYAAASLSADARAWLDQAASLAPEHPVVALERAWDQAFRLGDWLGARSLAEAATGPLLSASDGRKLKLLRQRFFLGSVSLAPVGSDNYVSTLQVDRDDVWAGTWNGAVVRLSLLTGQLDLVGAASANVAPVKALAVTGWFVYSFQDQQLMRYSKVTGTWRTFPYPSGWTGLRVQGVVAEGQETLWVAYLGQGLWRWEQGQWTQVDDAGGGPFLNALAADGHGGFWVGTKDQGLWSWNGGVWTKVPADGAGPVDISVVQPGPGGQVAVGTWGEGLWLVQNGGLTPVSLHGEYATAAAWTSEGVVWATLDEGLLAGSPPRTAVGPLDGLPAGGVSALAVWSGRWIWGTTGQGLGWWSEHENPALLR